MTVGLTALAFDVCDWVSEDFTRPVEKMARREGSYPATRKVSYRGPVRSRLQQRPRRGRDA
jgi:hypothetical protein